MNQNQNAQRHNEEGLPVLVIYYILLMPFNSFSFESSVTYLRLDGSVEPEKRFDIVKAFNSDPTIDALLLTTHG